MKSNLLNRVLKLCRHRLYNGNIKLKELIAKFSAKKELKKDAETNLDYTTIKARWDAISQFVDNAEAYGVDDNIRHNLGVINRIRNQHLGLPTEYHII